MRRNVAFGLELLALGITITIVHFFPVAHLFMWGIYGATAFELGTRVRS